MEATRRDTTAFHDSGVRLLLLAGRSTVLKHSVDGQVQKLGKFLVVGLFTKKSAIWPSEPPAGEGGKLAQMVPPDVANATRLLPGH